MQENELLGNLKLTSLPVGVIWDILSYMWRYTTDIFRAITLFLSSLYCPKCISAGNCGGISQKYVIIALWVAVKKKDPPFGALKHSVYHAAMDFWIIVKKKDPPFGALKRSQASSSTLQSAMLKRRIRPSGH